MRVFKWSPTFTPEQESSITPIWVNFLELPAHLYRKDALFAIANNIGTPLQIANSTLNQSNLAKARVCVEIDLLKPLLMEIDLKICDATIVQKIVYEHIPHYCSLCKHVGHSDAECYSKGNAPKPPPHRRIFGKMAAERHKLKGKAVAQDVVKVLDKMPEKMEVGECSKTAEERHRYDSADLLNDELDNYFQITGENDIVNLPNYAVNTNNESCRKGGENVGVGIADAENDVVVHATRIEKKDLSVVVVETENDVAVDAETEDELHVAYEKEADNLILDNTVNVETGGRDVEKAVGIIITRPNYSFGELWRGKRWISADNAFRLIQNFKRFGVVIKGIKDDVEEVIKRNRLAVSSAIRFQKCVLLFDPIRQLYLKPLDTAEESSQGYKWVESVMCCLDCVGWSCRWAAVAGLEQALVLNWPSGPRSSWRDGWTGSDGRGGLEFRWACRLLLAARACLAFFEAQHFDWACALDRGDGLPMAEMGWIVDG
ncbi:UNVERIFIED_CONTAM: hypothetical protein Sangu_0788100 [Sesamum angustifolium]|uniref:DUF4283 domain-containing protein n=1 Tax=Sesamum angustifolium TaxID=2727405 RepID=A0AAW2PV89_9LAMI